MSNMSRFVEQSMRDTAQPFPDEMECHFSGLFTKGAAKRNTLDNTGLLAMTSEIVAAHMSRNEVAAEDIQVIIQRVYASLHALYKQENTHVMPYEPAVPIEASVTPDYIVCLEDGKKLKMLKRHLRAMYNMSSDEYRRRWGLASDYPMVAPNYAKKRSELAKISGLGTSRKASS